MLAAADRSNRSREHSHAAADLVSAAAPRHGWLDADGKPAYDRVMTDQLVPTFCTVTVSADGSTCGAPAVSVLPGGKYAECAEHDMSGVVSAPADEFAVGGTVTVRHAGVDKTGTIVAVLPTRLHVSVPVPHSRSGESTKVVIVPRSAVVR